MGSGFAALAALWWVAAPARAQTAAASSSTIAEIRLEGLNVFNPAVEGEDWWPFRVANKIHIMTKERVIRRELLLGPGEAWDPLKALESERNLRSLNFFRYVELRPQPRPDGRLELRVRTQDSWTLNPQFSAGTEGGQNFLIFGVSEDNLLGYGKSVSLLHAQRSGGKLSNDFRYDDVRFMGSRFHLSPFYRKTNHGDAIGTEVTRPFFSLATPYAVDVNWSRTIDQTEVFRDATDYTQFLQRSQVVSTSLGRRLRPDRLFVQRVEAGWYSQKDQFNSIPETVPGTLPGSRELSGPTLGYSWVQPKYVKETYINRMERVEDFNMGNEFKTFGGYMGSPLGSDRDRWIFNVLDQQGLYFSPGRFLLGQAGASGRVAGGQYDNTLFFANLNLFWQADWPAPQTWISHLEASTGRNLDPENQVILGGNTGLRGYKNNSFVGGRSVLLNLEDRLFYPGEYFHLFRFGGAVFFDSGSVVPEGSGFSFARFKSDIGAGLRVALTRSQSGSVVRVDLAYALNEGPGGSRMVLSIRGQQAFQIFNSSTRNVRQSPSSKLLPPP